MANAADEVPDYMVAVKSEYLVEHKGKSRKSITAKEPSNSDLSPSADSGEQLANSTIIDPVGHRILETINPAESISSSVDGVPEGYKSNGYKLDDRDKQRTNNWENKKDYTGGNFLS